MPNAAVIMFRWIAVTLCQAVATVLVLAPLAITMGGPLTSQLNWPLLAYACLCLFPIGVFLHWMIAKKTSAHAGWAYWLIVLVSVQMLLGFPAGTMMGGVTIWILRKSQTFQRMRNGSPPDVPP